MALLPSLPWDCTVLLSSPLPPAIPVCKLPNKPPCPSCWLWSLLQPLEPSAIPAEVNRAPARQMGTGHWQNSWIPSLSPSPMKTFPHISPICYPLLPCQSWLEIEAAMVTLRAVFRQLLESLPYSLSLSEPHRRVSPCRSAGPGALVLLC